MSKFDNSKKDKFLGSIPVASLDLQNDKITEKCKFNFSYMVFSQSAGQKFEDWDKNQLVKLLDKLCGYSEQPLKYWQKQRVGSNNNKVLEVYGSFPLRSDFQHPKHVPHQALWARFRLESSVRLIGFVIPESYDKQKHKGTKCLFDCNVFYVVFLDANHRFYISKKRC